ncbi:uncharacterized protein LOC131008935 [Salvia miltiorrhiza]|uniref:uncharacterized protein LOC131008935 n=1 Tax=Salvia miltiorrhiza TaxID=226208 RepID=UPI0025ACA4FA|nr:uncharacterized protein LOC131008935 [Salvia miltiorrhiza]
MLCFSFFQVIFRATMSSAMQGNSDMVRARGNKTDKTRRSWTMREEEVLLAALKDLVVQGWKSDNGFRAGYLNKLEDAMRKEFPNTDLKGMPHINSKTTAWKKNYYSLSAILNRSGVGFNLKGTHMIECNDDQWQQIVKCDANARLMRFKSWPHLDDWSLIFGKDRATGEHAEDVMDAVNDLHRNPDLTQPHIDESYHVQLDDAFSEDISEDSVSQNQKGEATSRGASKKRKVNDNLPGMHELLVEINRTTDKRLETIASRIGYDFDLSKARKEIFAQLSRFEALSLNDKFDACELITKEVEKLDIFTSLPDEAKEQYVLRILAMRYN